MAEDADLAFEFSTLDATIKGHVTSIKNPDAGTISVDSVGEVIIDEFNRAAEGAVKIVTAK